MIQPHISEQQTRDGLLTPKASISVSASSKWLSIDLTFKCRIHSLSTSSEVTVLQFCFHVYAVIFQRFTV